MRVIVKYKKDEVATYISHLDVQRSMQRTLKRSGLPIRYTNGFHPHIVLTFAQPLPVAVESLGDYMEFSVLEFIPLTTIKAQLNAHMPPGFYAVDCGYIRDGVKSLMSLVDMCEWIVQVDEASTKDMDLKCKEVLESKEVFVEKHTKKGMKTVEIRNGIFDLSAIANTDGIIHMRLASGGKLNVSPKMVLSAMGFDPKYAKICRKDIFFEREEKHFPLIKISK